MSEEPTTLESIALMLVKLDGKVDTMGERLDSLSERVDTMAGRLDSLTDRVDTMAAKLDDVARVQQAHGEMLRDHGRKLDQLLSGGVDMSVRHVEVDDRLASRVDALEHAFLKHLGQAAA